jgi:hypothetical protein
MMGRRPMYKKIVRGKNVLVEAQQALVPRAYEIGNYTRSLVDTIALSGSPDVARPEQEDVHQSLEEDYDSDNDGITLWGVAMRMIRKYLTILHQASRALQWRQKRRAQRKDPAIESTKTR